MARPEHYFDWEQIASSPADESAWGTRERLRWVLALFTAASAVILARAVQLELSDGATYRELAARPIESTVAIDATRGAIVARDGTVLAADRTATGLALDYRYLQWPPDPQWLRGLARRRLPRAERRDARRLAAMEDSVRDELQAMHARLAALCGLTMADWRARTERIETRVTRLADSVNRRRFERFKASAAERAGSGSLSVATIVAGLFAPPERLAPRPVVVAEQRAFHRIASDLKPGAIAEIREHAAAYPGVRIVEFTRREYPLGTLAAHSVGHVGAVEAKGQAVGLMGIERTLQSQLAGVDGQELQLRDHRGRLSSRECQREPRHGQDVVLSLDVRVQHAAEQLLDRTTRRLDREEAGVTHGGAIVVLDIYSGEVLVAAGAPRFDPNWFTAGDPRIAPAIDDPRRPLFDRAAKMTLPPGSVFKPLVALALLSKGAVKADEPFYCQGYLRDPDRLRCQIFRHGGVGHGDVTLADALARSCNVYFFHYASQLGGAAIVDFAGRAGFGEKSGGDLPDEAAGHLPSIEQLRSSGQTEQLAIGQGALTTTPLQIARLYAAIANGGYLVTPRMVLERTAGPADNEAPKVPQLSASTRIVGWNDEMLEAVREGLRRVVEDAEGTGYQSARSRSVDLAGKTGTAETGGGQPDHAWFAGYVPAAEPRYALAVAVEHGGSGGSTAAALARSLVEQMQRLGLVRGRVKDEG